MKWTLGILVISGFATAIACGGDDDKGGGGNKNQNLTPAEAIAACQAEGMSSGDQPCEGIDEYLECAETQCQAEYETCLGAGYRSGNFSGGACEEEMQCVADSSDKCSNDCFPADLNDPCVSCLANEVGSCVANKCLSLIDCSGALGSGGGPGTGGGTCDDLEACCDALSADMQGDCNSILNAAQGIDQACAAALSIYTASGQCSG